MHLAEQIGQTQLSRIKKKTQKTKNTDKTTSTHPNYENHLKFHSLES